MGQVVKDELLTGHVVQLQFNI